MVRVRSGRSAPAARRTPRQIAVFAACLLVIVPMLLRTAGPIAGQDGGTPGATLVATPPAVDGRLDLAAMALDAADLPDGFELRGESYAAADDWAAATFPGDTASRQTILDAGLEWWYESTYGLRGSELTLRSYLAQYADEAGARAGFAFLEDETATLPPGVPFEDRPIPGVESDPGEITIVEWEIAPGFTLRAIDATLRDGRVVAGVAMESVGGTIAPELGVVEDLAVVLAVRVAAVLAGAAAGFADPALPAALLPTGEAAILQEGYIAGVEAAPPALVDVAEGVVGGYVRTVGLPFPNANEAPPVLLVNLAIMHFASGDDAAAALYALESLTIPSPLPPLGESFRQQGEFPEVAGADRVNAARRALLPGGPVDSARVGFTVDDDLLLIEVAGAASLSAAEDAAGDLANLQAACLLAGGSCATALPTADLQADALVTAPDPAPVAGDPERAATFDAVWRTINDTYLYRTGRQGILFANYHEVDWLALRAEYEPRALAANSDEEFYEVVAEMVAELGDQHTAYLSPDDARAQDAEFAGELVYVGIGALLAGGLDPANPGLVLYVFPDSPAAAAGLARRDRILAVDGEAFADLDPDRAREVFASISTLTSPDLAPDDAGAPATLTVQSPGQEAREIEIGRAVGPAPITPIVERLERSPTIAYVLLIDFSAPGAVERIVAGLEALLAEGPLSGIVLDLRANPGGFVATAQALLGQFVSGEVGQTYSRDGTPPAPFNVEPGALFDALRGVPVVVLADDRMYSASEVTAGVLQNEGRATVVGVTTPGDVETLIPADFADGSRLYIAVALFDLPGRIVEGQGVIPDVPVAEDWIRYPFAEDPQIAAAVGVIQVTELETALEAATPEA